ncbi:MULTISPECIES: methionine ABC transporter ATP-binding protein [Brevibacillus]|uniref:methionine ABC transporter ATP-binding protein n=1 Tax=Brevibacillus TaxID=55080 RepID=UPI000D101EEC|nr:MULTISPECIES: methionine ABC transporter ATP-binding protein [Brevibacillus]PSJ68647.1 methionine ABC transporter ATP-binding protein [Brevibacillus brevis]RED34050.1 D-methionine transport system ATP-binding protein [Brevibacillus brevis]TQK62773.1 D-methionine transport system ATP-binding protein [Brevibacillus sp. AG162]VEF92380.1 Methionine import ATP-binding protein MetN [Brevibacillus brevis]GEC92972.1 methionine import ATP-binding protein MetN 1 [Brevibacillus brevis]
MIQLTDIHKSYQVGNKQVEALKGVSLQVEKGQIYGVIGFSGAGKSTLLRTINLLEKPTSGSVIVNGQNMLSLKEKELRQARKKIGIIFQHFNLLSSYNVFDNVAEILRMNRVPKDVIKRKVEDLLGLVGLSDKANAYPSQLSGGQKQRVGIARALATDPEILLCDEATSALDPQTTESILELLLDINRKFNLTIVLITHEMQVIKKICDQVAIMENGVVIEQGSVLDVFSNPQEQTTRNFIKTVFDDQVPQEILSKIKETGPVSKIVRVAFRGDAALDPVLGTLSARFPISTNLLYGSITTIKGTALGILLLHISGEDQAIQDGIRFLRESVYRVDIVSPEEVRS